MTIPNPVGQPITASDTGPRTASEAKIVALTGGGMVVGWNGFAPAADDSDGGSVAYVRVFDDAFAPMGDGIIVPSDLEGSDPIAQLAALPNGGFAVVYHDRPLFGSGEQSARVVRYDAAGVRQGTETVIELAEFGSVVGVEAYDDGRVAVAVADFTNTTISIVGTDGTLDVDRKATAFDIASIDTTDRLVAGGAGEVVALTLEAGSPVSTRDVTLVGFDDAGDETFSTLVFDDARFGSGVKHARLSDGAFVVIGLEAGELTAVSLSAAGAASAPVSLGTPSLPSAPSLLDVAADDAGGYLILLGVFDAAGPNRSDVFGLKVDASGAVEGAPFPVHLGQEANQSNGRGAYLADGRLAAAYDHASLDFRINEVRLQQLDPDAPPPNLPPTDITLALGGPVPLNEAGAAIGTLSAVDPDAGESFVFSIDATATNPALFDISGDALSLAAGIDGAALGGVSQVGVTVQDGAGNSFSETLTFTLEPMTPVAPVPVIFRGTGKGEKRNGKATDDVLLGRGGKDVLNGRGGDDRIEGGKGADRLNGGNGNDVIEGGRGRDVLIGGKGRDDFLFGPKDGVDRITDFEANRDDLVFNGGVKRFKDLDLVQRGDDLLVKAGRVKILLEDVEAKDLDRGDVVFG